MSTRLLGILAILAIRTRRRLKVFFTATTYRLVSLIGRQLTDAKSLNIEHTQTARSFACFFHIVVKGSVTFIPRYTVGGNPVAITEIVRHACRMKLLSLFSVVPAQKQNNLRNRTTDRHPAAAGMRRCFPRPLDDTFDITESNGF